MGVLGRLSTALLLALSLPGLVACNGVPGAESADVAPQRPSSTVSGFVVDDAISGALINVYAFDNGVQGELLASTITGPDGAYEIEIDILEQRPLLIEARGGSYVELATDQKINLKDDEVLRAVTIYQPDQPLSLMVTPLTHLVTALVEYQTSTGKSVEQAIADATTEINSLFGFDVASVYPRSIADQGVDSGLVDEHLYGFFLSALSSWTKRVSELNDLAPHEVYNSIGLSQILYNEIVSDGLLDGKAAIHGSDKKTELALGVVGLGPDRYRLAFAQHMLAMAAGPANATSVTVEQLRPFAFQFVNSEHRLFDGVVMQLVGDQIQITTDENLGNYRNGVFEYVISLGSPEMISSVSFTIDGQPLATGLVPGEMVLSVDSRQYLDGEHVIMMVAKDWLGNVVASHSSVFNFDNTAPFVSVASGLYTNDQSYILSGEVSDNGAGIVLFQIQGKPVSINADNSWSVELQLEAGNTPVSILLRDAAGNEFSEDYVVTPDQTAPVIDSSLGHGVARFSIGAGQSEVAVLEDENSNKPLFIETSRVDLDGLSITRTSLETGEVPYFSFHVYDPIIDGISTATNALAVQVRYEKNGIAISDWRTLTRIGGEFLVPLASETLHSTWHQATPADEHAVHVKVQDKAGNIGEKRFVFKADFVVPEITVDQVDDLNLELFTNTPFSNRGALHEKDLAAVAYTFTNTAGKAIYIQPSDLGNHVARREFEQLVREHKARLVSTPMWRVGVIENVSDMCLATFITRRFQEVNEIYHFNGAGWVKVVTPASTTGEVFDVFSDTPPADSELGDVDFATLFDSVFAQSQSVSNDAFSSTTTSYDYDYLLNISTSQGISQPVYVDGWQRSVDYTNPAIEDEVVGCNAVPYFKQFERYSYESEPGYPKDSLSLLNEQQSFSSSDYGVLNETLNVEISPVSGWYRIPAGHTAVISKHVQTPALTVDDDVAVANAGTDATYTPLLYDQSISWSVNRQLTISTIHDAGADNIFSMTINEIEAGSDAVVYSISR